MKSFTPNPRAACRTLALLLVMHGLAFVSPAAEFIVGPADHTTLQAAVDAAAAVGNNDAQNVILIRAPVLFTSAAVQIGAQFNGNRQLVIRPDPSVPDLPRVTIISENGFEPILLLAGAGHVTLQDLDLVRQTTNNDDLLQILDGTSNVVERCRIGSDWPTPSLAEWSHVRIERPVEVIVRNCVCFARLPGNLARGISVITGTAQNHSVCLYNNTVADFGLYGIEIEASGSSFVLLRNNVVVNHRDLATEPTAFHSHVSQDVDLQTSHNTAFASEASVELLDIIAGVAADSIAGAGGLLRFDPPETDAAFRETEWKLDVGWNGNHDLFRLRNGGPLHGSLADAGVEVHDGNPHARDKAVNDDWERDPRHTGDPSRTDRGADQFAQLTVGDIDVILPRIPVFTGVSVGSNGAEEFEITAVTDIAGSQVEAMSGGEISVAGAFVSIDTLRVVGFNELRIETSLAFDGGNFMLSWPRTVRGVFVQASSDLVSWTTLFRRPVADGEMMRVTLPTTGPQQFFRLLAEPPTQIAPTQLPPDPTKPHGQIAAIRDGLNGLVARDVLPEQQALSLGRELDGSLAWLRRARVEPSLLELGLFRTTIEALVRNGALPTVDADPLLALVTTAELGISALSVLEGPVLEPEDYCEVSAPQPPCPEPCPAYTQYHVSPFSLVVGDRDGSEERPFTTITDALAQAALVGINCVRVDVRLGGVAENLVITRNTWIRGVDPGSFRAVLVGQIKNTGPYELTLEKVSIQNNAAPEGAVFVDNACARTTLDNVHILDALSYGVRQRGGTLTAIDLVVARTRHDPDSTIVSRGTGIYLTCGVHAAMLDVLLDGNESGGLVVAGAGTDVTATGLTVEDSDVHPRVVTGDSRYSGAGVEVRDRARLLVQVFELRNNQLYGLRVHSFGHAEFIAGTISGTRGIPEIPRLFDGRSASAELSGTLEISDFTIADGGFGILTGGADGEADLHWGVVSGHLIGAVVFGVYDLDRLQDHVTYIGNDQNLQADFLPSPDSVDHIDLGDD